MAATTAILLAAAMHGRHVVAVRPLYGGTDHLLDSGLLPIDVTFAEPHEVAQAIRPDTGLVFIGPRPIHARSARHFRDRA